MVMGVGWGMNGGGGGLGQNGGSGLGQNGGSLQQNMVVVWVHVL